MKNCLLLEVYHLLGALEAEFEAIDIAKRYSTQESGKFVNGILDKVRGELMRPARIIK